MTMQTELLLMALFGCAILLLLELAFRPILAAWRLLGGGRVSSGAEAGYEHQPLAQTEPQA